MWQEKGENANYKDGGSHNNPRTIEGTGDNCRFKTLSSLVFFWKIIWGIGNPKNKINKEREKVRKEKNKTKTRAREERGEGSGRGREGGGGGGWVDVYPCVANEGAERETKSERGQRNQQGRNSVWMQINGDATRAPPPTQQTPPPFLKPRCPSSPTLPHLDGWFVSLFLLFNNGPIISTDIFEWLK